MIPQHAELSGTVRCLDIEAWRQAPDIVVAAIDEVANLHRAKSEITYVRGVPPVVNDADVTGLLRDAMVARCGEAGVEGTEQSLGGEDFSWYLERVPGAMARLGVRTPASAPCAICTRATSTRTSRRSPSVSSCSPRRPCWTRPKGERTVTERLLRGPFRRPAQRCCKPFVPGSKSLARGGKGPSSDGVCLESITASRGVFF